MPNEIRPDITNWKATQRDNSETKNQLLFLADRNQKEKFTD